MTGQTAKTSIHAVAGLSLSGAGEFAEKPQDTHPYSRVTPLILSPIASSTTVQVPTTEQTSRSGQTHGAGQAYGAGQADARETKAPIEKFFASPGRNVGAQEAKDTIEKLLASSGQKIDARETKAPIEKFVASPEQNTDARETRAAIEKFFALSENSFSAQDARPLGSIGDSGNEGTSQNSSPLLSWTIPIGIAVFVTFVAKVFGQKRQTDDRPLDYNY